MVIIAALPKSNAIATFMDDVSMDLVIRLYNDQDTLEFVHLSTRQVLL